jgi:hypothetical protein
MWLYLYNCHFVFLFAAVSTSAAASNARLASLLSSPLVMTVEEGQQRVAEQADGRLLGLGLMSARLRFKTLSIAHAPP